MTFLVLLIALLVERFFDFSHLRQWFWLSTWERQVRDRLKEAPAYAALAAVVLPLVLAVMLVSYLLGHSLYGFPGLVFDVAVLLYCFGPRNLWADAFACVNVFVTNPEGAATTCETAFGVSPSLDASARYRTVLERIFSAANRRVFGFVFWTVILGVGGAVLVRLVDEIASASVSGDSAARSSAVLVENALDWAPSRVLTLLFAFAGNFAKVMAIWPKKAVLGLTNADALLVDCGLAAVLDDATTLPDDGKVIRQAVGMLDRSFGMALFIVFVLMLIL